MTRQGSKSDPCNLLTAKQLEALDLLVKHKTSKEISRELGISPHTVDQRIDTAKRRLGVSSRSELVQTYLHLKRMCHELTYEESYIDDSARLIEPKQREQAENSDPKVDPLRTERLSHDQSDKDYRVIPELFEGGYGTTIRLIVISFISIAVSIIFLSTVSLYRSLTELLPH